MQLFLSKMRCVSWVALAAAMFSPFLRADDESKKSAVEENQAQETRRAAFMRAMRTMAEGLKVVRVTKDGETECKMVEGSLLNWSDSARHPNLIVPGTTWLWHHQGRPHFIGEIYGHVDSVGQWSLFACTLSPDQVRIDDGALKTPLRRSYYEPKEIAGSPAVAKTKSERTFQMRQLVERFDAHQFWDDRFELRLLPKAIHRYEDVDAGIIDGALYAMVHGTNPEVLLLIEAHGMNDPSARWKVGFGSLAGARCVVRLDGKEFWTCPRHVGEPTDPRCGFYKSVQVIEDEKSLDGPR
jgi:hypothetical protein